MRISKGLGASLESLDGLAYGRGSNEGFNGEIYIGPGVHQLVLMSYFLVDDKLYRSSPSLTRLFEAGKRYDLKVRLNWAGRSSSVELTEY